MMRAAVSALWPRQAGAAMARQWRARQARQAATEWMMREPTAGCVGIAFVLSAVLILGALYLLRATVPFVADLAQEIAVMGLFGTGLIIAARVVRRRRR